MSATPFRSWAKTWLVLLGVAGMWLGAPEREPRHSHRAQEPSESGEQGAQEPAKLISLCCNDYF